MTAPESITCPQCGRTSYNPNDVRERYCGACYQWHNQMPNQLEQFAEQVAAEHGIELDEWQRYWLRALGDERATPLLISSVPRRSHVGDAVRRRLLEQQRLGLVRLQWHDRGLVVIDEVATFASSWWLGRAGRGVDELGQVVPERDPEPCGWHQRGGYRLPGVAADVEALPRGWPLW